ncbi:MAG: MATE family efflux transporter [Phycisphaerales bacterium]
MSNLADNPPAGASPGSVEAIGTTDAAGDAQSGPLSPRTVEGPPREHPIGETEVDPHPLREIMRVAAPSVATMTSYTLMTFVDALMVSRITPSDPIHLAAQGNGGISAWLPQSILAGMVGVVNTYVAQNLGAGHARRGAAYAWNALYMCVALWALMLPYALLLPPSFRWLGHAPELVALETSYAQILLAGALFQMGSRTLAQFFYGVRRPGIVLIAALAGNFVNLGLDWVLIFGNLGAPAMGVTGAAVATVAGCAIEFIVPMAVFLSPRIDTAFSTRAAWRMSSRHLREIWSLGWPGGVTFLNEMVCWWYFMVGMTGSFGPDHNTAGWIALRYMHLSFMPAVGVSNALTSVVGRYLGMGRPDLAESRARLGLKLTMIYMGACALVFVTYRDALFEAFDLGPEIIKIGAGVMIVAAVFQVFDALGITMFGALRGAGDTIFPSVATVVLVWLFLIGGGRLLMEYAPGLQSLGPWIGAATYISLLGVALYWRFNRGNWKRIKLVERAPA